MGNEFIYIFPYLWNKDIIKFWDIEIIPEEKININELNLKDEEIGFLKWHLESYRDDNFWHNKIPDKSKEISFLRYKWNLLIKNEIDINTEIIKNIYLIFLLLKTSIPIDYFNYWHCYFNSNAFNLNLFSISSDMKRIWGKLWCSKSIYTFKPYYVENLNKIMIYPKNYFTNLNSQKFLDLFKIKLNQEEQEKIYNVLKIYFHIHKIIIEDSDWNYIFIKISIFISSFEVLFNCSSNTKNNCEDLENLSKKFINEKINEYKKIENNTCIKNNTQNISAWIAGRFLCQLYAIRNDYLHSWKERFDLLKFEYKNINLNVIILYDIIFQCSVLAKLSWFDILDTHEIENYFKFNFDEYLKSESK